MKTRKYIVLFFKLFAALVLLLSCGTPIYVFFLSELNMGKEPEFPKIQALPKENELIFFQSGHDLKVTTLRGKVSAWEPSERFYDASYSWSEKRAVFSIWGKENAIESESRNFYTLSLDGQVEMLPGVEPYAVGYAHEWSPDGKTIAFPGPTENPYNLNLTDLFLSEFRSSVSKQLTFLHKGSITDLAWSPDGNTIAFVYYPYENHQPDILYRVDPRDGALIQFQTGITGHYDSPKWSPDGKWLSFLYEEELGESNSLWIMNIDTNEVRLLFKSPRNKYVGNLAWSPDGQKIAFTSNHQGACKTFVVGETVTREEAYCGYHIYTIEIDGKNMQRITSIVSFWNPTRLFWIKVGDEWR